MPRIDMAQSAERIKVFAFVLFVALVFLFAAIRFQLDWVNEALVHWALASLIACMLTAAGGSVFLFLDEGKRNPSPPLGYSFALGVGLFSLLGEALLALGLFRPLPLAIVALAAFLLGMPVFKLWAKSFWGFIRNIERKRQYARLTQLSLLALILNIALLFAYASLPPILYDSLVHHLAWPSQALLTGNAPEWPNHLMGFYPKLFELALGLPLAFGSAATANAFTAFFALASLAIVYRLAMQLQKREDAKESGLIAAALVASLPLFLYLAMDVKNDIGLLLFSLAALSFLHERSFQQGKQNIFAGLFFGFALGVKYSAIFLFPALMLYVAYPFGFRLKPSLRFVTPFLIAALIGALPFYLRVLWQTGSPVYPFLASIFGFAEGVDYARMAGEIQRIDSFKQAASFFPNLFFDPFRLDGDHGVVGGATLALLAFVPFLKGHPNSRRYGLLFLVLLTFSIPLILFSTKIRFYPLVFILPALFVAEGMRRVFLRHTVWRFFTLAILGLYFFFQLSLSASLSEIFFEGGWRSLTGAQTREAYLQKAMPSYEPFSWINQNVEKRVKVLISGERRAAYLERAALVASPYEKGLIEKAEGAENPSRALFDALEENDIAAVYIDNKEAERIDRQPIREEILNALKARFSVKHFGQERYLFYSAKAP